jgi:hypothetical protein
MSDKLVLDPSMALNIYSQVRQRSMSESNDNNDEYNKQINASDEKHLKSKKRSRLDVFYFFNEFTLIFECIHKCNNS